MKKNSVLVIMVLCFAFTSHAQDISKNAIGLRLGSNDGFGTEISYQARLSPKNRLELDLGWRSNHDENRYKLAGVYQWVWAIENGFNWYAGVGAGLGSWNYDNHKGYNDNGTFAFVAGDLGVEYNFDFPLQVSLDIRPEIYLNSSSYNDNTFGPDLALGLRYKF